MPKNLSIPLPKEFTTLLHMSSEWLNKARQFECKLTKVVNLSMLLLLSLCLPCFRYTTIWSDYNLKSLQGHNFLIESFRDGYIFDWGFPSGSVVKNLPAMLERQRLGFNPWVRKIPWRWDQPTPVLLGESHWQRSLVGYGPWGHKELDMTEATEHTCIF